MKARRLLIIACCLNVLVCAGAALGDGGIFFPWAPDRHVEVLQPTQKVYIRWDGSEEKLLIQTKYEGPAEDMVWIVPVPSQPTVERGDDAVFDELGAETALPDISYTDFLGLQLHGSTAGGGRGGTTESSPVEWHRRVGDYDVVLLRPTEAENVLQWLNSNGFGVPVRIAPVLQDYIENQWWMVASKIHPDALTEITRDKLANGMLHPLEMVFQSSACVYPLRLTSMAAGPVEELIYIEGPKHYEPETFADDKWEIELFGGPIRQVPGGSYLSDVEHTTEIVEGRTTTAFNGCITRLRRVFQPEEMVADLVFKDLGYAKWLADNDPLRVAQAATQYGRHRDPNGIAPLLSVLSGDALDRMKPASEDYQSVLPPSARILSWVGLQQWSFRWSVLSSGDDTETFVNIGCTHVRSCIWALGEIALEHEVAESVEDTLVRCAKHDNQLIRMEAYLALMKLRSEEPGPILSDRVADVLGNDPPPPTLWYLDLQTMVGEMEIVTDWIRHFGTAQERKSLVGVLARRIEDISPETSYLPDVPERQWSAPYGWAEWIVWRAACTQDARLTTPLQGLHARIVDEAHLVSLPLLRAEAACGSTEATIMLVRQIIDDQARVLEEGQADETGGITSLLHFYHSVTPSLRVQIIRKRWEHYELFPMPPEASDTIIRSALSEEGLSDWYALCLLARIKHPQDEDKAGLLQISSKGDELATLVAADVLYAWGDEQILMDWYDEMDLAEVRSEVAWALADLRAAQAVAIVEEQVRESWNELWKTLEEPFLLPTVAHGFPQYPDDPTAIDGTRKAETLWRYFHPTSGVLDEDRLACFKRLAADSAITAGVRIELLTTDYETVDWAKPLMKAAAAELLETDPSPTTVRRLVSYTSSEFVVDVCGEANSDEFRRAVLNSLLSGPYGRNQAVVEGLLWEVWPQRYAETNGESLLFRDPRKPDFDGYHANDIFGPTVADAIEAIVKDASMPAGYRAFLLVHWLGAPQRISRELVESLLEEDMPSYLREGLEQRLLNW